MQLLGGSASPSISPTYARWPTKVHLPEKITVATEPSVQPSDLALGDLSWLANQLYPSLPAHLVIPSLSLEAVSFFIFSQDYAVVGPFMLLNVLLQLTIAVKVLALSNNTYSENVGALFEGGCTNMDQTPALYGIVWPKALQNATVDTYDCSLHLVTMSFYPELLDLNGDQLWSMTEALQKAQDIKDASGIMPHGGLHGFQRALKRMIADDVANAAREGYPLRSSPEKGYLDLAWFQRNREKLKVCEVADKHMCGNLEADHVLDQAFPDLDPDQRVAKCSETEQLWCRRGIFGESQHALYKHKKKTCGAETYIESHEGLPILSYESVETYRGDEDSVTGSLFFTLFLIVLFVWPGS